MQRLDWAPLAIVFGAVLAALIGFAAIASMTRDLKGRSHADAAKKIIQDAEKRATEVMIPVATLTLSIVAASWACAQSVFPHIRFSSQVFKTIEEQKIYVYCEFIYFFTHLMNRHARSRLSAEQVEKLQEIVEPGIVRPAIVETFFSHWPSDLKDGIERVSINH
jgi:hypothetical protein